MNQSDDEFQRILAQYKMAQAERISEKNRVQMVLSKKYSDLLRQQNTIILNNTQTHKTRSDLQEKFYSGEIIDVEFEVIETK